MSPGRFEELRKLKNANIYLSDAIKAQSASERANDPFANLTMRQREQAILAQRKELDNLKEQSQNTKATVNAIKDMEVKWCIDKIHKRYDAMEIIKATIKGSSITAPASASDLTIRIERSDNNYKTYRVDWLEGLGMSEWSEIGYLVGKSEENNKDFVVTVIQKLFIKMVNIMKKHNITFTPLIARRIALIQQGVKGGFVNIPTHKQKKRFAQLHDQGTKIDTSGINLTLPNSHPSPEPTVILEPELGIFFEDVFSQLGFFRAEDIHKAHPSFLSAIIGIVPIEDHGLCKLIMEEIQKRNQT